jgi:hypothetical protein
LDRKDRLGLRELLVHKVLQVFRVLQVKLGHKVHKGPPESPESPVLRARQELLGQRVKPDHRVHRAVPASLV